MNTATENTEQSERYLATVAEQLRLLTKSCDKVRIGLTASNGRSLKTDPMPAAEAQAHIDGIRSLLQELGHDITSIYVERWEA